MSSLLIFRTEHNSGSTVSCFGKHLRSVLTSAARTFANCTTICTTQEKAHTGKLYQKVKQTTPRNAHASTLGHLFSKTWTSFFKLHRFFEFWKVHPKPINSCSALLLRGGNTNLKIFLILFKNQNYFQIYNQKDM